MFTAYLAINLSYILLTHWMQYTFMTQEVFQYVREIYTAHKISCFMVARII